MESLGRHFDDPNRTFAGSIGGGALGSFAGGMAGGPFGAMAGAGLGGYYGGDDRRNIPGLIGAALGGAGLASQADSTEGQILGGLSGAGAGWFGGRALADQVNAGLGEPTAQGRIQEGVKG